LLGALLLPQLKAKTKSLTKPSKSSRTNRHHMHHPVTGRSTPPHAYQLPRPGRDPIVRCIVTISRRKAASPAHGSTQSCPVCAGTSRSQPSRRGSAGCRWDGQAASLGFSAYRFVRQQPQAHHPHTSGRPPPSLYVYVVVLRLPCLLMCATCMPSGISSLAMHCASARRANLCTARL